MSCSITLTISSTARPLASLATISAARDILEPLTGGRIEMYQQGERKRRCRVVASRFTMRILDGLVEKIRVRAPRPRRAKGSRS